MTTLSPSLHAKATHRRPEHLATGAAALLFVLLLIVQNLVRSAAPAFGADPHTVTTYFLDHQVATAVPLILFPIGMVAILTFGAGVQSLATTAEERFWARLGGMAVLVIAGLFGVLNVIEIALAIDARNLVAAPAVVGALWAVHGAAFGLDLAAIAIALVALSRVALSRMLIPRLIGRLAWLGAAMLFVASLTTLALAQGAPTLYVGFAGFVVWGVFLVACGIGLVRRGA